MKKIGFIVIFAIFISGCVRHTFTQTPVVSLLKHTSLFDANISLIEDRGRFHEGFTLVVNNKTDKDMEINWNKTLFMDNGKTNGTFMFNGVVFKDRNNQKAPDIIFAHETFTKNIYPNNLVSFYKDWSHDVINTGKVGVLLYIDTEEKHLRERIIIDVVRHKKEN